MIQIISKLHLNIFKITKDIGDLFNCCLVSHEIGKIIKEFSPTEYVFSRTTRIVFFHQINVLQSTKSICEKTLKT